MSNKARWGYHGDVNFTESDLPKGAKEIDTNQVQGSSTPGHEHIVSSGKFKLYKLAEELYLVAKTDVTISMSKAKEKHRDVTVPMGTWAITRAIEADHIAGVVRLVCD